MSIRVRLVVRWPPGWRRQLAQLVRRARRHGWSGDRVRREQLALGEELGEAAQVRVCDAPSGTPDGGIP